MSLPKRISLDRLTVNLRVDGEGPPLLYLGGSSFDLAIRAAVFSSDLAQHFTVAAADPRGLGKTDAPPGDWSMQDYALDALSILDHLGWESAFVLGESFGAMIALHLASHAPDRVRAMALCSGAPGGPGRRSFAIESILEIDDHYERACRTLSLQDSRFDPDTPDPKMISARILFEQRLMAHGNNAQGIRRLLKARAQHDAWNQLSAIKTPTLIFSGIYDLQAPPNLSEMMATQMPNAKLYRIKGGHNICFNNPKPVQQILNTWIETSII